MCVRVCVRACVRACVCVYVLWMSNAVALLWCCYAEPDRLVGRLVKMIDFLDSGSTISVLSDTETLRAIHDLRFCVGCKDAQHSTDCETTPKKKEEKKRSSTEIQKQKQVKQRAVQ